MGLINWKEPLPLKEEEEPHFENELAYLEHVWRDPTQPTRLRFMAAKACADFHFPSLRAVAHVTNKDSAAAMLERARERAAPYAKVIPLHAVPALPPAQHSPDELKPSATSAANGGQSSSGFKRRI
jgi:hypothetical protein